MRLVVGIAGGVLVALMLAEFFVAFLLPRRVRRDPRIARQVLWLGWRAWRRASRRLPADAADTMLGFYGPLGLIMELALVDVRAGRGLRRVAVGDGLAPLARSLGRVWRRPLLQRRRLPQRLDRSHSDERWLAHSLLARGRVWLRRSLHRDRLPAGAVPGILTPRSSGLAARPAGGLAAERRRVA